MLEQGGREQQVAQRKQIFAGFCEWVGWNHDSL